MLSALRRLGRHIPLAMLGAAGVFACSGDATAPLTSDPATETFADSLHINLGQMTKLQKGLYVLDLVVGAGATVATGSKVEVLYTAWTADGKQVDSNIGKTALPFTLGDKTVIEGWDLGLLGMKAGGKRKLVIASDLAYGGMGAGCQLNTTPTCIVAPNSTLIFDVQVLTSK